MRIPRRRRMLALLLATSTGKIGFSGSKNVSFPKPVYLILFSMSTFLTKNSKNKYNLHNFQRKASYFDISDSDILK